jgi:nitrite reductase (NADH) small subunit/3-phenylpropionate/trans-cinnamate dioxygenase ferredoxin subunit
MSDDTYQYHAACKLADITDDVGVPVEIAGRLIAIFRTEGAYYAIDDACPHKGAPLADGLVDDKAVTCTWHGWRFSLETGCWLDSPRTRVSTYPVRISGEIVEIGIPQ